MSFLTTQEAASPPRSGAFQRALAAGRQLSAALAPHALPLLFCAGVWALCHPYLGIVGDSRIYVGRALADLDPAGVGRDIMFVNDGQSRFSLFPILARFLVAHLGASAAAQLIGSLGCLCWFAAALALATRLAKGRAVWFMVVLICALPSAYGDQVFFSAENFAVPRPFAEAAILAAIAASIAGRRTIALGLVGVGFIIHPIMALPGLAVLAIVELRPRTLVIASVALVALSLVLGLAGVALFERLFVTVDDAWFGMLLQLSPNLFPTQWNSTDFGILAVAATTLVIGADIVAGRMRRVFFAALIVGLGGVLVSTFLGDLCRSLLVIQMQAWRSTWLMAVIAHYAYALCVLHLWPGESRGGQGRVTLAMLTLGCFLTPDLALAVPICALALALHFGRFTNPIGPRLVLLAWGATACLLLNAYFHLLEGYLRFIAALPASWHVGIVFGLRVNLIVLPLSLAVAVWFYCVPRSWPAMPLKIGAGLATIAAAMLLWNLRAPAALDFESLHTPPAFADVLNKNPGEVLWVDGKSEAWQVLGRPQWVSAQQVVSIVFSRPLAMVWWERARFLLNDGLIPSNAFAPGKGTGGSAISQVTRPQLERLCAREDAPALVIFPLEKGNAPPPNMALAIWTLPHTEHVIDTNETFSWHHVDRYAAVACAALRPGLPSPAVGKPSGGV